MSAYLERMRESIRLFEDAERRFADRTRHFARRGADAEFLASRDPERKQAQGDAAFYGQRAQMYALAALVEQGRTVPMTRLTAPATPAGAARFAFDHFPTIDARRPDEAYRRYAEGLDRDLPGWWATPRPMAAGLAREAQLRRDAATANEARDGAL